MNEKLPKKMFDGNKILLLNIVIIFCICTNSCTEKVAETPTPTPVEPKYLEWSYEVGKDPLTIQMFTFVTNDPTNSLDISDTTKIEDVFNGHLEGVDAFNTYRKLDMTKNSWSDQIIPKVPVDISGYEFSTTVQDELFTGLKLTNAADKNILVWARDNFSNQNEKSRNIYVNKIKPILDQKDEKYFKQHKKKPKFHICLFVIPNKYYESGYGGTVVTFSDGNVVVVTIGRAGTLKSSEELERILEIYGGIGHEFAGHQLESADNTNNGFVDYIGKKDQFGNTIDGFGHVNGPAPRSVFHGTVTYHLRNDNSNGSLLFPQEDKEFLSAFKEGSPSDYGNLKLMKTPLEKSNIPYIANMVPIKRAKAEVFMKNMWTDKILVPKGGRVSAREDNITVKSIISCH